MLSDAWKTELWRLAGVVAAALVAALLTGHWALALLGGLVLYVAWHLRQMYLVERWLMSGGSISQAPDSSGIWDQLVHHIYRLQQRNRRRKKRLTAILDRFHRSTEAMPDAAVVLGENREIEWANRAARGLLGIRNPQDHGQRIDNLVRDPAFHDYLAAGDFDEPFDIRSPTNEDVELNVRIIAYGDGQHLMMARDASSMRRLEAVRRDFVANVSHELRTPLTVITGYVESFEGEAVAPHVREGLDAIERQSRRMLSIVQDLLMLSRLEMEPPDPSAAEVVPVAEMAAGLARDAERVSGERGHRVTTDLDPALGLRGVAGELSSAFGNLVNNAVQHTPDGTAVRVAWRADGDGAVFTVADDGQGIDPRHVARLTERFYRVDTGRSRARGGTGLGLSVVKHAIARNGGELDIESTPGRGSLFRCRFPPERVAALGEHPQTVGGSARR
ncbi:MAG: phosphate regulon sensor histidine kinase PhoR [Halofilum sp. (in: g-proteobacteria)]|nr:phosphate regulon sensor histidine kinase PhoR [Halofilum sp. (in: g-proteobacteria)]